MSRKELSSRAIPRPLFALSLVFVVSLGLVALLIAYVGAPPSMASAPEQAPQAPQQGCLQIQNQTQDRVFVYEWLTYTLAFTNMCGRRLENVIITDTWATRPGPPSPPPPADYNGNLADPAGVVANHAYTLEEESGIMHIYLKPLDAGASATLVFTMSVPERLEPNYKDPEIGPNVLGNNVEIRAPGVTPAIDSDTTSLVGPVLELEKTIETESGMPQKERPGRLVTYTLSLRNLNAEDDERSDAWPATEVEIWEDMPSDLAFIDAQPEDLWTYLSSTHRVSWTLPSSLVLMDGETTYVTFTARVTTTEEDYTINNTAKSCWAIAAERLTPVHCIKDVKLNVLSPLDKKVTTADPPKEESETYPGRYIEYTVYVYNPLQIDVNDLRVTDTLPANSTGYFTFDSMVGSGPPPTGSPTDTVVWEGLSLPANGVISFTFRVRVDEQTPVNNDCSAKKYENTLSASAASFPIVYTTRKFTYPHVKVTKQIKLGKSVYPSEQLAGELVTYTVSIQNMGDTPINMAVLTDALPFYFRYDSMVTAPPGQPEEDDNVIWWDDVPTIAADETLEFSFRATVDGVPLEKYKNGVGGFSPDTYICSIGKAEVKVLSPIQGNKTAAPPYPEPIVQGESFDYSVVYENVSRLQPFFIDLFEDILPSGFEKDGSPIYTHTVSPPFELQPERASSWEHTFSVQVVGEGAGTPWCDDLGKSEDKRKIYQEKETVLIHTLDLDPDCRWKNAEKLAPVYIMPHVDLYQEYNPSTIGPTAAGVTGTTTVTLSLVNNTRGELTQPITDIAVTYEMPADFTYLGVVSGTPEPDTIDGNLVWQGVDLPESGTVELSFRIEVPGIKETYTTIASAAAADPSICIPAKEAKLKVVKGVTWSKTPDPKEVGPFGTIEYTIKLENLTLLPATGIRVTDTLPTDFEFIEMTSEHTPVSLDPLIWEIPYIAPSAKEYVKFTARAYVHLGYWRNAMYAVGTSTYVTRATSLEKYSDTVKVFVGPGVGLFKTVTPTQVLAGEPVTYTITLYNGTDKNMANTVLTDTLPDGFSFGGMVEGQGPALAQGTLTVWNIDRLDKGDSLELVFRADTAPNLFDDTYYNQVCGEAWNAAAPYGSIDVPCTDLTAPVVVEGPPTVERSKSVSPSSVRAGNLVTYTITLYNEMDEAQTVRLTDTLPVSITYVGVVAPTPAPMQTAPLVWDGLEIGSLQTKTLTFTAWVDLYARSGFYYNRLDATLGTFRLPPKSRLAGLWVDEIPRYDLQVSKSDGQPRADGGDLLAYTITYANENEADLSLENVVITDTFSLLPPYADATGLPVGWGQVVTNVYTYSVGTLGPNESDSVQFQLQLSQTIPWDVAWVISNTAEIGHSTEELAFETDSGNNQSTDVDILHGPDLVIDGIVPPPDPSVDEPTVFWVTVRNQGKDQTWQDGSAAMWFYLELYLKGTGFTPSGPPTGVFDHVGGICPDLACTVARSEYYTSVPGLEGNDATATLPFTLNVDVADDYQVYAQVDVSYEMGGDYGLIREAIETNNIFSYGTVRVREVPSGGMYLPLIFRDY